MLLIFTHPLPVNFLLSSPLGGLTFYLQALNSVMPLNVIESGCFLVTETIFYDSLHNLLLELRCVSFVFSSSWHNKTPHLLSSISYCLTNGVQFSGEALFISRTISDCLCFVLNAKDVFSPQRAVSTFLAPFGGSPEVCAAAVAAARLKFNLPGGVPAN